MQLHQWSDLQGSDTQAHTQGQPLVAVLQSVTCSGASSKIWRIADEAIYLWIQPITIENTL